MRSFRHLHQALGPRFADLRVEPSANGDSLLVWLNGKQRFGIIQLTEWLGKTRDERAGLIYDALVDASYIAIAIGEYASP